MNKLIPPINSGSAFCVLMSSQTVKFVHQIQISAIAVMMDTSSLLVNAAYPVMIPIAKYALLLPAFVITVFQDILQYLAYANSPDVMILIA